MWWIVVVMVMMISFYSLYTMFQFNACLSVCGLVCGKMMKISCSTAHTLLIPLMKTDDEATQIGILKELEGFIDPDV